MMSATHDTTEHARLFVGDRQIDLGHFYPIGWAEDGTAQLFAVGYWNGETYAHGIVTYSAAGGFSELLHPSYARSNRQ